MNLGLIITYVVITIYCLSLLLIFFYSLTILNLSVNYLKNKHQNNEAPREICSTSSLGEYSQAGVS